MIAPPAPGITGWPALVDDGRLLVVRLGAPHRALSWAVVRGGFTRTSAVVWRHVVPGELEHHDAEALLVADLARHGFVDAVGLLTARTLSTFDCVTRSDDGVTARAVATVGLGNAVAVGDAPGPLRVGTINVLVQLSHALDEAGLAEAMSIATEARTAAVLEARLPSRRSGEPATGTGTDCVVVAAPEAGPPLRWVGKHTAAGALVGGVARDAVARGVRRWMAETVARTVQARVAR